MTSPQALLYAALVARIGLQYNTIHIKLTASRSPAIFRANETLSTKQQNTTTTTVKNPNWSEAYQLVIYKCSWEVEPGTTRNKFNEWSERVLNPGSPDLKASALTTGPHCLLNRSGHSSVTRSFVCGLITYGDSNQQDGFVRLI